MRIFVVVPHYFGPSHPENNLPTIGSYMEPIARIAALNEMIVALRGQFGPDRYRFDGSAIPSDGSGCAVDILIVTKRDRNILPQLGLAAGTFEVAYVDGKPPWIHFHAPSLMRERLGAYDFYCLMEDDLIIRDPAFFEKLLWFQRNFGPKTLLAPVRYELASTGSTAKWIADPELPESLVVPFRRPDQRPELEGAWNDRRQTFYLPSNPHAGCFFLTQEQMAYWTQQPSFNDGDDTWVGPMESAGTYSVGRVFDIYKPLRPDPFFLEICHFGVRYSEHVTPPGVRHGEPPLLAIAQNALRAAIARDHDGSIAAALKNGAADASFAKLIEQWVAQGTVIEQRVQIDAMERKLLSQQEQVDALQAEVGRLGAESAKVATATNPSALISRRGHDLFNHYLRSAVKFAIRSLRGV